MYHIQKTVILASAIFDKFFLKYGYSLFCYIFKYGFSEYFFIEIFHSSLKIPIGVKKFETAYL